MPLLLIFALSVATAQTPSTTKTENKKNFQQLRPNSAVVKGNSKKPQQQLEAPTIENKTEEKCRETKALDGSVTRTCTIFKFDDEPKK